MTSAATKISYKLFNFQQLGDALFLPDLPLQKNVSWRGTTKLDGEQAEEPDLLKIIELARQRAGTTTQSQPTCRSSIIIEEVEGRGSRELEVVWWPDLYEAETCIRYIFQEPN